jgi:hypothetical protein
MSTFIKTFTLSRGLVTSATAANPDRNADCTSILTVANGGTGTATPAGITGTNSVVVTGAFPAQTATLVNDSAAPGTSLYYGTDNTGTRGWFTLPVSSTSGIWKYQTTNTMADPGSGNLRTDQTAWLSVLNLAMSKTDQNGIDRTGLLSSLIAGDTIMVQDKGNAANWCKFKVGGVATNNTTWFQLPVTDAEAGGTSPNNNSLVLITFQQTGGLGTGAALAVGTSTITGGTTGWILYDNAGILGEQNIIDDGLWS